MDGVMTIALPISKLCISGLLKDFFERKRDIGSFDSSACNLIKKRLKLGVIYSVENNYLFIFIVQRFCKLQSRKTSSNDDNLFAYFHNTQIYSFYLVI